jgi:hypothetical protein
MAEKNLDAQIAEKEAEIKKLKDEQEVLRQKASHQEFPKWIADPSDPKGLAGRAVANAEEEKAVTASYADAYAKSKKQRDLDKQIADLKAKHEKEEADAREAAQEKAAAAAAKGKK